MTADPNSLLLKKVRGILDSFENLPDKEKLNYASESYAQDYNQLRDLTLKHNPEFKDFMPPASFDSGHEYSSGGSLQSYGELQTYVAQIFSLLNPE